MLAHICQQDIYNHEPQHPQSHGSDDSACAKRLVSGGVTPFKKKFGLAWRLQNLSPQPDYPPPPVPEDAPQPMPEGKSRDASTCSVFSDESTDCVSEPSEQIDALVSDVGEQAFEICTGVEIDFDSLEFELTPDDINDDPSAIRTAPSDHTAEDDFEKLQRLFEPVATRLNSRAKAWVPQPSAANTPFTITCGQIACRQMMEILMGVQAAMASYEFSLDVETLQRPQGWAITVYVLAANLVHKEQIEALGKKALLESCKRSRSIYVVGYCRQPFISTPLGFSAILCEAQNYRGACWDFIKNGCCRYGNSCHWQHPNKPVLDVMIKIHSPD